VLASLVGEVEDGGYPAGLAQLGARVSSSMKNAVPPGRRLDCTSDQNGEKSSVVVVAPEPSSVLLLASGIMGLDVCRRRALDVPH